MHVQGSGTITDRTAIVHLGLTAAAGWLPPQFMWSSGGAHFRILFEGYV